jgi:hypothetical protein
MVVPGEDCDGWITEPRHCFISPSTNQRAALTALERPYARPDRPVAINQGMRSATMGGAFRRVERRQCRARDGSRSGLLIIDTNEGMLRLPSVRATHDPRIQGAGRALRANSVMIRTQDRQ